MFAYHLVGADYMTYETIALRQIAKYRVLGIGMRIIVSDERFIQDTANPRFLSVYTSVNSPEHSEYPYFSGSTDLMKSSEQSGVPFIRVTMSLFPLRSH